MQLVSWFGLRFKRYLSSEKENLLSIQHEGTCSSAYKHHDNECVGICSVLISSFIIFYFAMMTKIALQKRVVRAREFEEI
jgi:hypothetical protein